jgi:hypothetical protein
VIEYAGSYFRGPESSSRLVDESSWQECFLVFFSFSRPGVINFF